MVDFPKLICERILILDGAIGTMIQSRRLSERDFRGERFAAWHCDLRGNNDILALTRPDVISDIADLYIEAGADIITTDTFNANAVSQADYGMEHLVGEINREAPALLRRLADRRSAELGRRIFVAGSIGPTNKTASMSPDVNNPAFRAVSYDDLFTAYSEQIEGLIEGGVDILLFETIFDSLNLKAGLDAANSVMARKGVVLPIMLSVTLSGHDGRTFSGQTLSAFLASVAHCPIASVGLNCSFGAADMKPHLMELARTAPYPISCHPNAGLPNALGEYEESPEAMARHIGSFIDEGLVNIVGGCCGTTPAHIAAIAKIAKGRTPHVPVIPVAGLHLSGLEPLDIVDGSLFVNVGERCNVAGSRKFLRLIKEGLLEEAVSIARKQVEDGAQILDFNMDDGMMDARKEMCSFLNLIASEPDISRVPFMIDSSDWNVIESALKCVQGKSIVNSISLKEGEELFIARARRVRELGAAAVVMAFDEQGQADSYERKIEICSRAYRLLTERAAFNPEDIIFDPNILAIATGMKEHDRYGLDFIRAVEWIKKNLPGAKVSGGVSNLSFSFRGNNYLREAIHAVFLYHAIAAGLDMAIVNPSTSVTYEDIEPRLRDLIEDVVLCRRDNASEELIAYAQEMLRQKDDASVSLNPSAKKASAEWRNLPVDERLVQALIKGISDYLEEDLAEALEGGRHAVAIIDGPLMEGMNRVGTLFGEGKMFLPQVVKTARTMKRAVGLLAPAIESARGGDSVKKAGKVVFATVKGDVHDIGKNIVSIVLACNNYEVIDLGVMVPAEEIVRVAVEEKPDFVCLSGLITPSPEGRCRVVALMEKTGLDIPVMVGGATTSRIHTAVKIAPNYSAPVIHVPDASQNPLIASRLLSPANREDFIAELRTEYEALRQKEMVRNQPVLPIEEARARSVRKTLKQYVPVAPSIPGRTLRCIPVAELIPFINWRQLYNAWKLSGSDEESARIQSDALAMLSDWDKVGIEVRAIVNLSEAHAEGDDIMIGGVRIPTLRQQSLAGDASSLSLADFVGVEKDYAGAFVVSVDVSREIAAFDSEGDSYRSLLAQSLAHRLAEAASECLHRIVRTQLWGYAPDESMTVKDMFRSRYQGIRPAVGYPSLPDQKLTFELDRLLDMSEIGVAITENGAMEPSATVCGLYIAHPESSYFLIGPMADDQLRDYASRRGLSNDEVRSLLAL